MTWAMWCPPACGMRDMLTQDLSTEVLAVWVIAQIVIFVVLQRLGR